MNVSLFVRGIRDCLADVVQQRGQLHRSGWEVSATNDALLLRFSKQFTYAHYIVLFGEGIVL